MRPTDHSPRSPRPPRLRAAHPVMGRVIRSASPAPCTERFTGHALLPTRAVIRQPPPWRPLPQHSRRTMGTWISTDPAEGAIGRHQRNIPQGDHGKSLPSSKRRVVKAIHELPEMLLPDKLVVLNAGSPWLVAPRQTQQNDHRAISWACKGCSIGEARLTMRPGGAFEDLLHKH